ncbi:hypothetical protein [Salipiger bermudensis]|uniref:hypothetical protein n=1 Tax=Salipiger bermudensis TaxID=344736 RepID=UPI001CD70ACD|nr:hypothetical protein [Salipiger bermudensis]MCA0961757.1 hypothetical protein [Salipiger bermudensis]
MSKEAIAAEIALVSASELAQMFGFSSPNDAFRTFCRRLDVRPIRRNPNYFDAKLVRFKLDAAQGLTSVTSSISQEHDLVARRRARRASE